MPQTNSLANEASTKQPKSECKKENHEKDTVNKWRSNAWNPNDDWHCNQAWKVNHCWTCSNDGCDVLCYANIKSQIIWMIGNPQVPIILDIEPLENVPVPVIVIPMLMKKISWRISFLSPDYKPAACNHKDQNDHADDHYHKKHICSHFCLWYRPDWESLNYIHKGGASNMNIIPPLQ